MFIDLKVVIVQLPAIGAFKEGEPPPPGKNHPGL